MVRGPLEQWMRNSLARRSEEGTLRELRTPEHDGCLIDFTSNDYLGLGRFEELRQSINREEAMVLEVRNDSSFKDSFDEPRQLLSWCSPVTGLLRSFHHQNPSRQLSESRHDRLDPSYELLVFVPLENAKQIYLNLS